MRFISHSPRSPALAAPGSLLISLFVAVLVSGCDVGTLLTGQDCTTNVDKTIDLDSPVAPAVQLKIDSCRIDVDACGTLCSRVMADNNLGGAQVAVPTCPNCGFGGGAQPAFVPYTKCAVTFEGATTHVDIAYDQYNGGPNCPVFDNAGGGVP